MSKKVRVEFTVVITEGIVHHHGGEEHEHMDSDIVQAIRVGLMAHRRGVIDSVRVCPDGDEPTVISGPCGPTDDVIREISRKILG